MPLIAMTREMGSLGKDVAAAVADRLGKPLVHHEIIDFKVSHPMGTRYKLIVLRPR